MYVHLKGFSSGIGNLAGCVNLCTRIWSCARLRVVRHAHTTPMPSSSQPITRYIIPNDSQSDIGNTFYRPAPRAQVNRWLPKSRRELSHLLMHMQVCRQQPKVKSTSIPPLIKQNQSPVVRMYITYHDPHQNLIFILTHAS